MNMQFTQEELNILTGYIQAESYHSQKEKLEEILKFLKSLEYDKDLRDFLLEPNSPNRKVFLKNLIEVFNKSSKILKYKQVALHLGDHNMQITLNADGSFLASFGLSLQGEHSYATQALCKQVKDMYITKSSIQLCKIHDAFAKIEENCNKLPIFASNRGLCSSLYNSFLNLNRLKHTDGLILNTLEQELSLQIRQFSKDIRPHLFEALLNDYEEVEQVESEVIPELICAAFKIQLDIVSEYVSNLCLHKPLSFLSNFETDLMHLISYAQTRNTKLPFSLFAYLVDENLLKSPERLQCLGKMESILAKQQQSYGKAKQEVDELVKTVVQLSSNEGAKTPYPFFFERFISVLRNYAKHNNNIIDFQAKIDYVEKEYIQDVKAVNYSTSIRSCINLLKIMVAHAYFLKDLKQAVSGQKNLTSGDFIQYLAQFKPYLQAIERKFDGDRIAQEILRYFAHVKIRKDSELDDINSAIDKFTGYADFLESGQKGSLKELINNAYQEQLEIIKQPTSKIKYFLLVGCLLLFAAGVLTLTYFNLWIGIGLIGIGLILGLISVYKFLSKPKIVKPADTSIILRHEISLMKDEPRLSITEKVRYQNPQKSQMKKEKWRDDNHYSSM